RSTAAGPGRHAGREQRDHRGLPRAASGGDEPGPPVDGQAPGRGRAGYSGEAQAGGVTEPGGRVYLVGAGPGDPELITVRGLRLLQRADVVVHDRLVSQSLLGLASEGCERIFAGKSPAGHAMTQEAINMLLIERAR